MNKSNNHIEEYFLKSDNNSQAIASKELFKNDNVETKTELSDEEILIINKLKFNDSILERAGLKPVFNLFTQNYMILKISKERKSRQEFVNINKADKTDEIMSGMGNLSNILNVRK